MSKLGIHFSHDFTVAFSPWPGEYRMFELERFTKVRYDSLDFPSFAIKHTPYDHNTTIAYIEQIKKEIIRDYGEEYLKIEGDIGVDQYILEVNEEWESKGEDSPYIKIQNEFNKQFNLDIEVNKFVIMNHHDMHAYSAFYQSPFEDAVVISLDGGGVSEDGAHTELFNGYLMSRHSERVRLFSWHVPMCPLYDTLPYISKEIVGEFTAPGKAMGMSGYRGPVLDLYNVLLKYMKRPSTVVPRTQHDDGTATIHDDSLLNHIKSLWYEGADDKLDFDKSAVVMSSMQMAFENAYLDFIKYFVKKYNLPLVITGGAGLNVLNNTRVKHELDVPVYVPCNPNDTGTAIGSIFLKDKPKEQIDLRFANFDLFDRDKLEDFVKERGARKIYIPEIAKLLREGKIFGIVKGRTECGPRALGNRSIICDPSFPDMQNILNAKVKYRQWYRPFAPMVIQEEASEYFNWDNSPAPNMSYSTYVRGKYQEKLKGITHCDKTARIQTISQADNPWYFKLLTELKRTGPCVVLNTSFNIKGRPILNTIEDALQVLDTTELDYVIVEDYFFGKQ